MKRIAAIAMIMWAGLSSTKAQQIEMYTQYMLNQYAYNPGISGVDDHYQLRLNTRQQWMGMEDAPFTIFASYYGRKARNKTTGLGASLFSDVVGPTTRTGAMGSYTHHLKVRGESKLGLGLTFGLVNYAVKTSDIFVKDAGDKIFTSGNISALQPDAAFGAYFYNPKYYLGVSVKHLMGSELNWPFTEDSRMANHMYFVGGYKLKVGQKLVVEPSVLIKYVKPVPFQTDGGIMLTWMERVNLGYQYRTDDAMSVIIGYDLKSKVYFGYSYDITTSPLQNYSSGTHEIMLGYRFIKVVEEESQMELE